MTLCAICGEQNATTRDHVPPKSIFPTPRPNHLVTVPCCFDCNNGASDLDDLFKVYLSLQAAGTNEIAIALFENKTLRTLERNQRLLNTINEQSTRVQITNDKGEKESRLGVQWNSKAHDAVIERTIRGLYFHHSGHVVPRDTALSVQWLKEIPKEVLPKLHLFQEVILGDSQVIYKYYIYPESPQYSLWLFDFYGAHWASGHTEPINP